MGRKSNTSKGSPKGKKLKKTIETHTAQVKSKPVKSEAVPNLSEEKGLPLKQVWLISLFFFALAFILYSNTFEHRFVLDDHGIIDKNRITKAPLSLENTKLIFSTPMRYGDKNDKELSLYRPITKLLFNAEWNWFKGDSHSFHKVNAFIYALLCMLGFWVMYEFFERKWGLPFLICLLFAVHPIHTEVVANSKSLDEILALIGILGSCWAIQRFMRSSKSLNIVWAALFFALGIFSKESAIVGLGVFPLLMYYQLPKWDWKKVLSVMTPLVLIAVVFVVIWQSITVVNEPSIMDNLIVKVKDNYPWRFATAVMLSGFYVYTFLVPHPLACDYSFSTFEPVGPSDIGFLISFLLFVAGLVYVVRTIQKKDKLAFGILWFFITFSIGSNVIFLIGTSFGERLLFTPSLGLSIVFVCLLARFFDKKEGISFLQKLKASPVLWGIVLLLSAAYSYKTIARNMDWRTNYDLFSRDVEYNENSTHLLFYLANHLPSEDRSEVLNYQLGKLNYSPQQIADSSSKEVLKSIQLFQRSMGIYQYLPADGYNQLGKAYFKRGLLDSAFKYYQKAFSEDSTSSVYTSNMGTVYFQRGQFDQALPYFLSAHKKDSTIADYTNNIGVVYGELGRLSGERQKMDSAIYWFRKSTAADSLDTKSLQFLELTYRAIGDSTSATFYRNRLIYIQQLRQQRL